jgi:predicted transcriptional regulator
VTRRPDGALEADVLTVLWRAGRATTPGEVRDALGGDLAYTTVMTVLSRLHDKGLLARERRGRAFAYSPVMSESELSAQRMGEALARARDRAGALSGFVGGLSKRDAALLRRVMKELE